MAEIVRAPWTDEQVAGLNAWQAAGHVHPFTCGSEDHEIVLPRDREQRAAHPEWPGTGHAVLIATPEGWVCSIQECAYRQDWAHDFMLQGPPPNPLAG